MRFHRLFILFVSIFGALFNAPLYSATPNFCTKSLAILIDSEIRVQRLVRRVMEKGILTDEIAEARFGEPVDVDDDVYRAQLEAIESLVQIAQNNSRASLSAVAGLVRIFKEADVEISEFAAMRLESVYLALSLRNDSSVFSKSIDMIGSLMSEFLDLKIAHLKSEMRSLRDDFPDAAWLASTEPSPVHSAEWPDLVAYIYVEEQLPIPSPQLEGQSFQVLSRRALSAKILLEQPMKAEEFERKMKYFVWLNLRWWGIQVAHKKAENRLAVLHWRAQEKLSRFERFRRLIEEEEVRRLKELKTHEETGGDEPAQIVSEVFNIVGAGELVQLQNLVSARDPSWRSSIAALAMNFAEGVGMAKIERSMRSYEPRRPTLERIHNAFAREMGLSFEWNEELAQTKFNSLGARKQVQILADFSRRRFHQSTYLAFLEEVYRWDLSHWVKGVILSYIIQNTKPIPDEMIEEDEFEPNHLGAIPGEWRIRSTERSIDISLRILARLVHEHFVTDAADFEDILSMVDNHFLRIEGDERRDPYLGLVIFREMYASPFCPDYLRVFIHQRLREFGKELQLLPSLAPRPYRFPLEKLDFNFFLAEAIAFSNADQVAQYIQLKNEITDLTMTQKDRLAAVVKMRDVLKKLILSEVGSLLEFREYLVARVYQLRGLGEQIEAGALSQLVDRVDASVEMNIDWAASQFLTSKDPSYIRSLFAQTILNQFSTRKTAYSLVSLMRSDIALPMREDVYEVAVTLRGRVLEAWTNNEIPHSGYFREALEILQLLPDNPRSAVEETDLIQNGKRQVDVKEVQSRVRKFGRMFSPNRDFDEEEVNEFLDQFVFYLRDIFVESPGALYNLYERIARLAGDRSYAASVRVRLLKLKNLTVDAIEDSIGFAAEKLKQGDRDSALPIRILRQGLLRPYTSVFTANIILSLSSGGIEFDVRRRCLAVLEELRGDLERHLASLGGSVSKDFRKAQSVLNQQALQEMYLERDVFLSNLSKQKFPFGTYDDFIRLEALFLGLTPATIDSVTALRIHLIVEKLRESGELSSGLQIPQFEWSSNGGSPEEFQSGLVSFYSGLYELFKLMKKSPRSEKEKFMLLEFFRMFDEYRESSQ